MKIFQNKRIWQKIVIILLLILLFKFAINTVPVYAETDDGVLLEPITGLFANLGDGIMEIMQKTFLGVDSSGAWIESDSGTWAKILTIVAAIVIAVVAIAAAIVTGGGALVVIATIAGAVIKIGIGTAIAYFAVSTIKFRRQRILFTRISINIAINIWK